MKKRKPQIIIFDPDTLDHIGIITKYTSLVWSPKFRGKGTFEFWCSLDQSNIELIKAERLVWFGDNFSGVILSFEEVIEDNGSKKLDVKGMLLNEYISRRIIWGTHVATKKNISVIIKDLVNNNCVSPTDKLRKIKYLEIKQNAKEVGEVIDYQKTGGNLLDELEGLCEASEYSIGFKTYLEPKSKKIIFEIITGQDRTRNNSQGNFPVVLSTDLKDILSSKYYYNCGDVKTTALVAGEDVGVNRKKVTSGDISSGGIYRKELYVDARDLKSVDEDTKEEIPTDIYLSMLQERGLTKLSDYVIEENFETEIRTTGKSNYNYGEDYFLGDKVTIEDKMLGISVDATILEVNESWEEKGYTLKISFGYSKLMLSKKIKRMMK